MSLDLAIKELEGELAAFKQGTRDQPAKGTTAWFVLRAKALGLSSLRRMKQLELGQPESEAAAETFYRNCSKTAKLESGVESGPPP